MGAITFHHEVPSTAVSGAVTTPVTVGGINFAPLPTGRESYTPPDATATLSDTARWLVVGVIAIVALRALRGK